MKRVKQFGRVCALPSQLEERDWLNIAKEYKKKWNFGHIGSIDGKYIKCVNSLTIINSLNK